MIQTGFVGLEMKVLFILILVAVSMLQSSFYKLFLVVNLQLSSCLLVSELFVVVVESSSKERVHVCSCKRANTVKQEILYWTCTGLAVEVIGLVPTHD